MDVFDKLAGSVLSVNEMSGPIFFCAASLLTSIPRSPQPKCTFVFHVVRFISVMSLVLFSPSPPSRLSHALSVMWAAGGCQ